ncbi:MAG: right-handed parallel beta-helix repeat-containing protein [Euryarchaeota archaeon]|nr:right-handed parallel beta-helix repeat-containing protein [Euryarchaeota archaeon]
MKKLKGGIVVIVFLISLLAVISPVSSNGAPPVVWVDDNGPDNGYDHFDTIGEGISAVATGGTVYVAAGTYNEHLGISTKNLSLIGDGATVTTINGSSGGHPTITVSTGVTVNISNLTITGATGMNGNGIFYSNSSGTVRNNTIMGNAQNGIYVFHCSPTIRNNTITGNSADGIYNNSNCDTIITDNVITGNTHSGIYNYSFCDPLITNNTITGNTHNGIYNFSSCDPLITNNTITGNTHNGIYNFSSCDPLITNNVIAGNTQSGIVNFQACNPMITNNTITGNTVDGIRNIGSSGCNPTITNNIVSSNISRGISDNGTGAPICTYNNVWGNGVCPADNYYNALPSVGSISQDPQLDATYHLTGSSPCIDAGIDTGLVYTDMDGDSRPQGSGIDIGADEYLQLGINPIAAFLPLANYHLAEANALLADVEGQLPEDVPKDTQDLLDKVQMHINNANTTGNTIYANNELLKAIELLEQVLAQL